MRFRRPDGKSAKLTLGPYDDGDEPKEEPEIGDPLSLAAARQLATKVHRERNRKVDVIAEYKAAQERNSSRVRRTCRQHLRGGCSPILRRPQA